MTASAPATDLSVIENRATSVADMFLDRVRQTPQREAYRFPDGDTWQSRTWREVGDQVERLAAGLVSLGVEPGQRVAVASSTRFEWILADLAIMCAGAATTTVYPSTVSADVAFILADSDSRVVFAEDETQVAKLREHRAELPSIRHVIVTTQAPATNFPTVDTPSVDTPSVDTPATDTPSADTPTNDTPTNDTAPDDWVMSLSALEERGAALLAAEPDAVDVRVKAIEPDSLATLIYTSGTTGRPKGVRLRHSGWTYEGAAVASLNILTLDDVQFLWLPMAHSFGKVLLTLQLQVGFPTAVDGRVDKIVENLGVIRPTFMGAAPRIFEKAYGRVVTLAQNEGGAKAKIFDWACAVGRDAARHRIAGEPVPATLRAKHAVADRLVFSKVRDRFGGRVRFFISGSAALSQEVAEWFNAAGILILEGYGLTESSAGSFVNHPDSHRFGTVGHPLPGTEVDIADDGEILVRGPGVMDGYHNLEQETAAALIGDGWLATGDIGEVDADGFLRITDRKKDLFKTSGGKYIAPSNIEGQFKAVCPLASQMVIHGHDRNFVTAIITLDPEAVTQWANHHGMEGSSYSQVVTSETMRETVDGYVQELNARLNRWEQIKKFVVLEHDLTIESGELTPSLKVKRRVVETHYRDVLDSMYS